MAATRTTQADMLRTVYQPKMRVQFNLDSLLLQRFRRKFVNLAEGKEISIPLHAGRTGGYGWSDSGVLPPAGEQQPARANFNYKRLYGRIQIDAWHMAGARAGYAAEARPYDMETQGLVRQLRTQLNFHLFGDGSGQLSTCPAQTATSSGGVTELWVDSLKGIHKNQRIDLLAIADGAATNGFRYGKVTGIDKATKKLTIAVADWTVTTFNGDEASYAVYQSLNATTSSYGAVITGLAGALSKTNTYGGINRATAGNEYWHGLQIDAGTAQAPYLSLIEQGIDEVDQNSEGKTTLIVTTYELWTHLVNQLIGQKRWAGSETKLNGWARAIDFNGIPIVRDKHCPEGKMFFLDESTWTIFQDSEGAWMDKDGAILSRVSGYDAYEAAWSRYLQLVCDKPGANLMMYDLATTYPAAPS